MNFVVSFSVLFGMKEIKEISIECLRPSEVIAVISMAKLAGALVDGSIMVETPCGSMMAIV